MARLLRAQRELLTAVTRIAVRRAFPAPPQLRRARVSPCVSQRRRRPGWAPLFWEQRFQNQPEDPLTTLDKPFDAIEVWQR